MCQRPTCAKSVASSQVAKETAKLYTVMMICWLALDGLYSSTTPIAIGWTWVSWSSCQSWEKQIFPIDMTRLLNQAFAMPMLTTSSARHTRNGRTASRISIWRNLSTTISLWSTVPSPVSFLPVTSTGWLEGLIRIFSSHRHCISFHCFCVKSSRLSSNIYIPSRSHRSDPLTSFRLRDPRRWY